MANAANMSVISRASVRILPIENSRCDTTTNMLTPNSRNAFNGSTGARFA